MANSQPAGPDLRSAQILYSALMIGLMMFALVAAFVGPVAVDTAAEGRQPLEGILMWVAAGLSILVAAPSAAAASLLFGSEERRARMQRADRVRRWVGAKIFGAALAEGPGLLWCLLTLMSGSRIYLLGAAFSILILALSFPRSHEFEAITSD